MAKIRTIIGLLLFLMLSVGCEHAQKVVATKGIAHQIDSLKQQYAPDRRVAIFEIDAIEKQEKILLKGETDQPEAYSLLKEKLSKEGFTLVDSVTLLPDVALGDTLQGVITNSVANLRSKPKHSAELATQATLGTPVKILKKKGEWYYIQTPDRYLAWVDHGGIVPMSTQKYKSWQSSEKIIYTKTYGQAYSSPRETELVSDLVAGNVLVLLQQDKDYFKVAFPDGRTGWIRKSEAQEYDMWRNNLDLGQDGLVATAQRFMGVPYLWGGTSAKGMDCSGFTKTVYFLNGLVIPRDASQQVHTGKAIDSTANFRALQKGDLLFFGRKATDSTAEKVVHVGMWIGNNEFIHASERVRISSMDEESPNYDAFNHNRYLRTKRIFKEKGQALLPLAQTPIFKD